MCSSEVVVNNLGGHGPDTSQPRELRFRGVGQTSQGQVDAVLRVPSGGVYWPKRPALNGLVGDHGAASVNVAQGHEADLDLLFVRSAHDAQAGGTGEVVKLRRLFVSVFDSEDPIPSIVSSGEIFMRGFEAAKWPNGTSTPIGTLVHPNQAWSLPSGPAPLLEFRDVHTVSIRLRALESPGNSMGGLWAGRNFFIAVRSPDLQEVASHERKGPIAVLPSPHLPKGHFQRSQAKVDAVAPKHYGDSLLLTAQNVVYNNLGGAGPHTDEPPVLRFDHAGYFNGRPLDVVLRARGPYHPKKPEFNGQLGNDFGAAVNVALGTSLDLEISLEQHLQGEQKASIQVPQLFLSVCDAEEPDAHLTASGEVAASHIQGAFLPNGTVLHGPTGEIAYSMPPGPAPIFEFRNASSIQVTLRAAAEPGSAVGGAWAGRTFLLALRSPSILQEQKLGVQQELPGRIPAGAPRSPTPGTPADWEDVKVFLPSPLGTKLVLNQYNVAFNNLGGKGPGHSDEPPVIRFSNIGAHQGRGLDLVVRALGSYEPSLVGLNAQLGHRGVAAVNVKLETSVKLQLEIVASEAASPEPISLKRLYLSVCDTEDPIESLSADGEVQTSGFQAVKLASGHWASASSLDLARETAWAASHGPAPVFAFWNTGTLVLTLRALRSGGGALGGAVAGRTFFISLWSPDVEKAMASF
ncbi:unnamed protein product [Symbiodinium natans]|uniref:Uncharacterized protein n=1 Tax=Symbiodinium natans TaxID=878477 RepID=A0A812V8T0_9DINO|nr:unnamed protein product [Symbiodinium natans]